MNPIKLWLFNTFFARERRHILEIAAEQGSKDAFAKAHADIRETMADDLEKRANELATQKLESLLSVPDIRSIVTIDTKARAIFIGGERADDGRLHNLKAEAQFFVESDLWKLLSETPKQLAHKAMFKDDGSLDNLLLKGRAILYMLDTQQQTVELFKGLSTGG